MIINWDYPFQDIRKWSGVGQRASNKYGNFENDNQLQLPDD